MADAIANYCLDRGTMYKTISIKLMRGDKILMTSDGAFRRSDGGNRSSIACCMFVYRLGVPTMLGACVGLCIDAKSSVDCEFQVFLLALHVIWNWLRHPFLNMRADCEGMSLWPSWPKDA
jgi:hypothetical protein